MCLQYVNCLFVDLDGLLVDTECFHYKAYQRMCQTFGYHLEWDLDLYLQVSGSPVETIEQRLRKEIPELLERHSWAELYAYKQRVVYELMENEEIPIMPHVAEALSFMLRTNLPVAVVTNSSSRCVEIIRSRYDLFDPLTTWVTREQYKDPKPAPDCYISALRRLQVYPQKALGFEDTLKGVRALRASGSRAVLVNPKNALLRPVCSALRVPVYDSLACVTQVLLERRRATKVCG